jgi:cytochrome c peroxidase
VVRKLLGAVTAVGALLVAAAILGAPVGALVGRKPHTVPFRSSLFLQGQRIFRYDTFGDQAFWGGALGLQKAIEGASHGGVGPGVSPKLALALGLKVDSAALPKKIVAALKAGEVDLNDPATTLALLKLNAVVGVRGFFNPDGTLASVGITCAVCHSTVDNSFAPGIGRRLDGWPNRDLNVGAIVAAAPNHQPILNLLGVDDATLEKVLKSWGPGKFDAEVFLDGKAFQPDGRSAATLIPPAYGLAGVNLHTYEGWGSVPYWNAFVANLEMHGQGNFTDVRLDDAAKFPIAARNGDGHTRHTPDLITSKLPALHYYQMSLKAPTPPKGSFDPAAAAQGSVLFNGKARCATCHVPPNFTDAGWNLHKGSEICIDNFQADRSPTGMYRTTPLRGAWAHAQGGYFHDGRFPTLAAVVDHYDSCFGLGLTATEKNDLVQFLKSR